MRWPLLLLLVALAGCAAPPTGGEAHWSFTTRADDQEPVPVEGHGDAFAHERTLTAAPHARQIGGQWHGPLVADIPFTLSFSASTPMRVEFRVRDASAATASGTCNWDANSTQEKEVGIGKATMRSTDTTCEIVFTPGIQVEDDNAPTLRWEARSREDLAQPWTLQFRAHVTT